MFNIDNFQVWKLVLTEFCFNMALQSQAPNYHQGIQGEALDSRLPAQPALLQKKKII